MERRGKDSLQGPPVGLRFMKAGTSDALVLTGISRQAFNSDAEAGAASGCPVAGAAATVAALPES